MAIKPRIALGYLQHTMTAMEWNADTADHIVMLLTQAGFPLITIPKGHRIRIELDTEYEPDGDYDLEEERANLQSGDWGAYVVILERECDCGNYIYVTGLSGVVCEGSFHDGNVYTDMDDIPVGYLRGVACELVAEVDE